MNKPNKTFGANNFSQGDERNLYSVSNGDYYTSVLVIAKSEEEAIELSREVYLKDERDIESLHVDLEIENIGMNKTSNIIVW